MIFECASNCRLKEAIAGRLVPLKLKETEMKIGFNRFYTMATENACSGNFKLSDFEEVWQYGSNLDQAAGQDPCYQQDGVAPQCPIPNLGQINYSFPYKYP